jgi:hypothetical protein
MVHLSNKETQRMHHVRPQSTWASASAHTHVHTGQGPSLLDPSFFEVGEMEVNLRSHLEPCVLSF